MKYGPENSVLTNEGDMDKFIGIEITQLDEKIFKISQHYLINKNISFLGTNNNDYGTKKMLSQRQLAIFFHKYLSGNPRKESWNHRTAVGMLTYLQGNTFPETSMKVHQTALLCNNPMLSHEKAINQIGRYLHHTKK